jgi:hypothetical protein
MYGSANTLYHVVSYHLYRIIMYFKSIFYGDFSEMGSVISMQLFFNKIVGYYCHSCSL